MNIKEFILKVNDYICYFLLALVCLLSFLVGAVNPIHGAVVGVVGLLLFAFVTGYWFCLSSIAESNAKQLLESQKQTKLLEKIYKQGEANIELQFPNA